MKLLVFDIDGTLTDSITQHQSSYLQALSVFDIPNLNSDWNAYTHHTDSWIFAEIFRQNFEREPTLNEKNLFSSTFNENFDANIQKTPIIEIQGAKDFLKRLIVNNNYAYAFATGSLRYPAIRKLETLAIDFPSELLVTASEFETREEIVDSAISAAMKFNTVDKFEKIIAFGDGRWDLVTANKMKLDFVGIAQYEKAEILRKEGAKKIYIDFSTNKISQALSN